MPRDSLNPICGKPKGGGQTCQKRKLVGRTECGECAQKSRNKLKQIRKTAMNGVLQNIATRTFLNEERRLLAMKFQQNLDKYSQSKQEAEQALQLALASVDEHPEYGGVFQGANNQLQELERQELISFQQEHSNHEEHDEEEDQQHEQDAPERAAELLRPVLIVQQDPRTPPLDISTPNCQIEFCPNQKEYYSSVCGHIFCSACIFGWRNTRADMRNTCPICRRYIRDEDLKLFNAEDHIVNPQQLAPAMEMLQLANNDSPAARAAAAAEARYRAVGEQQDAADAVAAADSADAAAARAAAVPMVM
jgi:hypothetical protein